MRQMELCHPSPMEVWVTGVRVYDREGGRRERESKGETKKDGEQTAT